MIVRNRKWKYIDPSGEYEKTESDILAKYFECWSARMKKTGREHLISEERCIEDWVVVNWAQEVKD